MQIDARKKEQYFKNINGLNDVYVWRNRDKKTYDVGINGTSYHYKNLSKEQTEVFVTSLILQK